MKTQLTTHQASLLNACRTIGAFTLTVISTPRGLVGTGPMRAAYALRDAGLFIAGKRTDGVNSNGCHWFAETFTVNLASI